VAEVLDGPVVASLRRGPRATSRTPWHAPDLRVRGRARAPRARLAPPHV